MARKSKKEQLRKEYLGEVLLDLADSLEEGAASHTLSDMACYLMGVAY